MFLGLLKRALLAIWRRKNKSALLIIIFIVISNLVLSGLAIKNGAANASVIARQKLGGKLTLSFDRQKAMSQAMQNVQGSNGNSRQTNRLRIQSEPVTEQMADIILENQNIVAHNFIVNTNAKAENFQPVPDAEDNEDEASSNNNAADAQPNNSNRLERAPQNPNLIMPDVSIIGVSSTSLVDAFKTNSSKLIEGRHISNEDAGTNVAIIEKNLAEYSNLAIGDKIKLRSTRSENKVELTVVGIYEAASQSDDMQGWGMRDMAFSLPYNRIYCDYKSALPLKNLLSRDGIATPGGIDQIVFYVNDPANIDNIKQFALQQPIDWSKFTLDANDFAYQQMMKPIQNVASFSTTAVIIVCIASAIILSLLLTLSARERTYETGVLLSLGESKPRVVMQFVLEIVIIALVAFSICIFTGREVSNQIGNTLLSKEIQTYNDSSQNNQQGFGRFGRFMQDRFFNRQSTVIEPIDNINTEVSINEIIKMFAAGIAIIIISTIIPVLSIVKYNPKTILTKAT